MADEFDTLDKLADKLAANTDIPYVPEAVEGWGWRLLFRITLGELEKKKPELIPLIKSAADGIQDDEVPALTAWLVDEMNQYGSFVPALLRTTVAGAIVTAMRKGFDVITK